MTSWKDEVVEILDELEEKEWEPEELSYARITIDALSSGLHNLYGESTEFTAPDLDDMLRYLEKEHPDSIPKGIANEATKLLSIISKADYWESEDPLSFPGGELTEKTKAIVDAVKKLIDDQ